MANESSKKFGVGGSKKLSPGGTKVSLAGSGACDEAFNARGVIRGSSAREIASARGSTLHEEGVELYDQGEVNEAMNKWQEALDVKEAECGEGSFETADTLNNIAGVHSKRNEFELALEKGHKAHVAMKRELETDPLVAAIEYNIGSWYRKIGEKEKSEEWLKDALTTYAAKPDVANSLNCVGNAYVELGQLAEAEKSYDRALGIGLKKYGKNHLRVTSILENLVKVYNKTSKYDQAMANLEEALDAKKALLGQEHAEVGKTYFLLGSTFFQKGQTTETLTSWKEALRIQRKTLGDHEDTATTLYFMGLVQGCLGRPVAAVLNYEEALGIYRAIGRDDDDARVASILGNLQVLRNRTGQTTAVGQSDAV